MKTSKNNILSEKNILRVYLLGFIILVLSVALFQPLANLPPLYGNPPDEHARYLIPKYICEHGTIPTGMEEEVRIPAYGFSYALYNVFPYIVQGYVMRFVNLFTNSEVALLYSARMVNVVFGTLMAVVVYLISRRVFTDRRFRWLFCFVVMYLPESIFVHTYVNTDSCCMLATAMMVYALVRCYQEGINKANSLWMCGGIILCALSYYNAYGYILSCIFLFFAYFLQKKDDRWSYQWKEMLKWGCFIGIIVLLGISWWFIRSYIVLDGDIIGLATREKMAIQYAIEEVNPLTMVTFQNSGKSVWEMIQEMDTLGYALKSFVGVYGGMTIWGGEMMYLLYNLFFGAGVLGCVYYLCNKHGRDKMSWRKVFFHGNMIFCIMMPLILMLYYSYTTDYQPQGRYLLPALIPLMGYVIKGFQKLLGIRWREKKLPDWMVNAVIEACFLLIIFSALDMIYFYAMPIYLQTGLVM